MTMRAEIKTEKTGHRLIQSTHEKRSPGLKIIPDLGIIHNAGKRKQSAKSTKTTMVKTL